MLIKLVYEILIVKQDSGIFAEFRASILSFGHPGFFKCGSFGHPRVEIRASLAEILPPRLAMFRRLHNKFCGPDKDTQKIIKPCKYHPLETCNSDEIAVWMCLPWEAAAMLGCPKLEFRAPVGALCFTSLSGVPDYFGRNKISSGGDLSHYSRASLY